MRVYSYVVEHDLGFAPNPFHGVCTLACCKPQIRKRAALGDIILGMGAAKPKLGGKLIYWMRVEEILTFDQYWRDARFGKKRPRMIGSRYLRYGDNIYHLLPENTFCQAHSFHSLPGGAVSAVNLSRDTGTTDKVLIGRDFSFFGRAAIDLPADLQMFVIRGRPGHKCKFEKGDIERLAAWLMTVPRGYRGEPAHWQFLPDETRAAPARTTTRKGRA